MEGKGLGVFVAQCCKKGEFVCHYKWKLLHMKEARKRESMYKNNEDIGSYMYYFPHKGEKLW